MKLTQGFSGRDLASLCQESIIAMIRDQNPELQELTSQTIEQYSLKSRAQETRDIEAALKKIKPASVNLGREHHGGRGESTGHDPGVPE